jgi:hypothetical protein
MSKPSKPTLFVKQSYIPVTVRGNTIKCPDAVKKGSKNHDSKLEWRMETAGFAITDIVFDPPGQTEFYDGISTANGGWKVTDSMSVHHKDFKYTITVKRTVGHGGDVDPLDPMIRNEP